MSLSGPQRMVAAAQVARGSGSRLGEWENVMINPGSGRIRTALSLFTAGALWSTPPVARAAVLAEWTFETTPPTGPGPHAANSGVFGGAASGLHASPATVYDNPSGNGSVESFS